ncbi:DUF6082 family protein [Streptomyces sp. NPDC004111]|uniref:DUF6082 family protein n=1 Tax=Streptomyces sp. NPDC004111 TaxID=3364690 RepID=UPI0036BA0D19
MTGQERRRLRDVAAGILFSAAVTALLAQQRQNHHRLLLMEKHHLHSELLYKAMDDPQLAEVLNTYETEVPPERQRQFLYANIVYGNVLHYCRIGVMDTEEALGHLRGICQSRAFRDFWDATQHHRESLPGDSPEAVLGRQVDLIVTRASEERDNWWVA